MNRPKMKNVLSTDEAKLDAEQVTQHQQHPFKQHPFKHWPAEHLQSTTNALTNKKLLSKHW